MKKGNGESGKSTVIKQMKLIHASGFDNSERESFRVIVFANITLAMQILLEIIEQLNIPLEHPSYSVSIKKVILKRKSIYIHISLGIYSFVSKYRTIKKK